MTNQIVYETPQEYFTIAEAAKVLNLSPRTISEYLKAGKLRCSRLNRQVVRISRANLQELMDKHSSVTSE
jgi:excisionase family DNA binding protein